MNKEEILKLTALWYEYVGMDHHKDCDCNWYIVEVWSYGDLPRYRVEHNGYIFESKNYKYYKKRDAVEKAFITEIKKAFKKELKWAKEVFKSSQEYDQIQFERAAWLINN